jgi:thymidylate synthase (FAD)
MPRVKLLSHTADPERLVAIAARVCYSPDVFDVISDKLSPGKIARLVRQMVDTGHHSTLEHSSYTFGIAGLSRVASHQLVRHRIASFSQASQRYISLEECFDFETPLEIQKDSVANTLYQDSMKTSHETYRKLVNSGISKEDARFVLPGAARSQIIVTMNARSLLNFFTLRTCERAQKEIRMVARKMLALVREVAPNIFYKAGPACDALGYCPDDFRDCPKHPSTHNRHKIPESSLHENCPPCQEAEDL